MFDYNNIVSSDRIVARFEKVASNHIKAINKTTNDIIGDVMRDDQGNFVGDEDAVSQYELWLSRPERKVGKIVNWEGRSLDDLASMYEELLVGSYLLRFPDTEINFNSNYAKMIDWLRSTDFYRAPASTIYHESFIGGLLVHSLRVYNEAIMLNKLPKFKDVSLCSAALVALVHDWCKISTYESYQKNMKNEATGQWEKVDAFKRNYTGLTLGHGVTSMFYALRYMDIDEHECAAIRWHQGHWNVCPAEENEFQRCNEECPIVLLLQFADQLAITNY